MEVGLDHELDRQPIASASATYSWMSRCGIDDDGAPGRLVPDQVGSVRQALQVVLVEPHVRTKASSRSRRPKSNSSTPLASSRERNRTVRLGIARHRLPVLEQRMVEIGGDLVRPARRAATRSRGGLPLRARDRFVGVARAGDRVTRLDSASRRHRRRCSVVGRRCPERRRPERRGSPRPTHVPRPCVRGRVARCGAGGTDRRVGAHPSVLWPLRCADRVRAATSGRCDVRRVR